MCILINEIYKILHHVLFEESIHCKKVKLYRGSIHIYVILGFIFRVWTMSIESFTTSFKCTLKLSFILFLDTLPKKFLLFLKFHLYERISIVLFNTRISMLV